MFGGGRDVWRGRVGGRDEDGNLHNLVWGGGGVWWGWLGELVGHRGVEH